MNEPYAISTFRLYLVALPEGIPTVSADAVRVIAQRGAR